MSRLRNICFTINNYTEEQFLSVLSLKCGYVVCGKEIGDGTADVPMERVLVTTLGKFGFGIFYADES